MTCHGDAYIHFTCEEPALTLLSVVPRFARLNGEIKVKVDPPLLARTSMQISCRKLNFTEAELTLINSQSKWAPSGGGGVEGVGFLKRLRRKAKELIIAIKRFLSLLLYKHITWRRQPLHQIPLFIM